MSVLQRHPTALSGHAERSVVVLENLIALVLLVFGIVAAASRLIELGPDGHRAARDRPFYDQVDDESLS